ncbi:MAG TPA: class I SAM-dependent methyltransferase [Burkholderiales bacterium]|nr:class I SAM-dependent methyltransferase [Burkholderiales bacterium]
MFPIYQNDGTISESLSETQIKYLCLIKEHISNGKLHLIPNKCLCNNNNSYRDVVIAEIDRYSLPIPSVICSKCGLVRSAVIFDNESNINFYTNFYRGLYYNSEHVDELFFADQVARGIVIFNKLRNIIDINNIKNLLEIGCGAGGIMYEFHKNGINCVGVDFDENYLAFGKAKGLAPLNGNYDELIQNDSQSAILLSHVLEHFNEPVHELIKICKKLKPNGYLIVEVPGLFNVRKVYYNPILYFQNAHIYNFFKAYLDVLFKNIKLNIIYGDESCFYVLQKPEGWDSGCKDVIYDPELSKYPKKIKWYFIVTYILYKLKIKPNAARTLLVSIISYLGLKNIIKRIIKK